MSKLITTPYFAGFSAVLNDHVAPSVRQVIDQTNGQTVGYQSGQLRKSLTVNVALQRQNGDKTITPAAEPHVFAKTATTKTASHSGLPSVDVVLTDTVIAAYQNAIDDFAKDAYPALVESDGEQNGVAIYSRLDSVAGNIPAGKPAESYVVVGFGLYEDPECTRQITDGHISLAFVSRDYVIRKGFHGVPETDITDDQIAKVRAANEWHDLAGLMQNPDVQTAVQAMAYAAFAALASSVHNWAGFDVDKWAKNFRFPEIR